ncbi:hypothetical protein M1O13_02185 [Dehalococcoidia bacterium]|nr:hypothetical protein [Dehalococcoidia bacterium]
MTRIREFAPHLGSILLTAGVPTLVLFTMKLQADFELMLLTGFTGCVLGIMATIGPIWTFRSDKCLVEESRSQTRNLVIHWGYRIAAGALTVAMLLILHSLEGRETMAQVAFAIVLMLLIAQGLLIERVLINEITCSMRKVAVRQGYLVVGLAVCLAIFLVLEFKGDKDIAFVSFAMIFIVLAVHGLWTEKLLKLLKKV